MIQEYPKIVKLVSSKLMQLLEEKAGQVTKGRAKSEDIEKFEADMVEVEKQLIEAERKVDLSEFKEREKEVSERMKKCVEDIDKIKAEIHAKIKAETPQELRDKYDSLKTEKDNAENERNKFALKAQKYNDKIIPLGRKLMKEHLSSSFEDYDTIRIDKGEIICTIFNHLEEWKINFNKKKK